MKRMMSRKSHSWWWDSHISPNNSRWLAENLQAMDRLVKEMLKLVEEEGDSFAMKAEMYYKRRPELVAHVENFYRMYRALAERYDNVTGELRKNIPEGLQSHERSVGGSDLGSESSSSPPRGSPSPEQTPERRFSRTSQYSRARAAGFDFFLGSGGRRAASRKGSETPSSSESESASESDEVKGIMGGDLDPDHVCPRMAQLERELQDVKEKLQQYEQIISDEDVLPSRVAELEAELAAANRRNLQGSLDVINQLRQDLIQKKAQQVGLELGGLERKQRSEDDGELHAADGTAGPVDHQELSMDELKGASVQSFSQQRLMLDAKMSEQAQAMETLIINEMLASSSGTKFSEERLKLEKDILSLSESNASLQAKLARLEDEMRELVVGQTAEVVISWALTEKRVEEVLNQNLDALKQKVDVLSSEKEELSAKVLALTQDVNFKDYRIRELDGHLHQLHLEHVRLITEAEDAQRASREMKERVKGLEEEVERQQAVITEGAEKKREAIRQLCFSLEHYRDGYRQLRRTLQDHRRLIPTSVLAS